MQPVQELKRELKSRHLFQINGSLFTAAFRFSLRVMGTTTLWRKNGFSS